MSVRFDPTINLGHLLTFAGFIVAMGAAYMDIDRRLSAAEVRAEAMQREMDSERLRTAGTVSDIKSDIRDIRKGIERLLERKP